MRTCLLLLRKIKVGILLGFLFCGVQSLQAQRYVSEESSFTDRLYFGGNFGLQFSQNFTQIEVSPTVGYMVNSQLSFGTGVIYQYFRSQIFTNGRRYELETNIYGGRLFGRYNVTNALFAYTEYENINLDVLNYSNGEISRDWVPGFFIGAGYFQPVGRRLGMGVTVLYNLIYNQFRSPYNSPWVIRVGFNI